MASQLPQDETASAQAAERKFMHDLATPLAVAIGQLEVLLELQSGPTPLAPDQKVRIEKAKKALDRIREMLITRRQVLVGGSIPSVSE